MPAAGRMPFLEKVLGFFEAGDLRDSNTPEEEVLHAQQAVDNMMAESEKLEAERLREEEEQRELDAKQKEQELAALREGLLEIVNPLLGFGLIESFSQAPNGARLELAHTSINDAREHDVNVAPSPAYVSIPTQQRNTDKEMAL